MLSDEARQQLREFLERDLYHRVKKQVLDSVKVSVMGSMRDISQTALDLAFKSGMEEAFERLERAVDPVTKPSSVTTPRLKR